MAPKKAKKVKTVQPVAPEPAGEPEPDQEEEEEAPLSLDDLPDQCLGIILRKLGRGSDRLYLTQASPSVRRLCTGPQAEPGVLGSLLIDFKGTSAVVLKTGVKRRPEAICLSLCPVGKGSKSQRGPLLAWLEAHSRAFESTRISCEWLDLPEITKKRGFPKAVASLFSSILASLSSAAFRGELHFEIPKLTGEVGRSLTPVLRTICALFPANDNTLYLESANLDSPSVAQLFTEASSFKEVTVSLCRGTWPPGAFSKCARLESLDVEDFEGVVDDFSLSPSWSNSLRSLALSPRHIDLKALQSFTALRKLKLDGINNLTGEDLSRLRVLEPLPSLVSLSVKYEEDGILELPLPPTPELRLSLPHLEHLALIQAVWIWDEEDPDDAVRALFPLRCFVYPKLLLLELLLDRGFLNRSMNHVDVIVCADSLSNFPALQCLSASELEEDAGADTFHEFDFSTLDFRQTPELKYVYTDSAVELPEPTLCFPLGWEPGLESGDQYGDPTVLDALKKRFGLRSRSWLDEMEEDDEVVEEEDTEGESEED